MDTISFLEAFDLNISFVQSTHKILYIVNFTKISHSDEVRYPSQETVD
jgi:hypothetical protein